MKRRNFLQATGLAWLGTAPDTAESTSRPVAGAGGPRREASTTVPAPFPERQDPPAPDRWFLDWLPPALRDQPEGYVFGTSTVAPSGAGSHPGSDPRPSLRVLSSHARLGVTVGIDAAEERDRLDREGYESVAVAGAHGLYGRSAGRRYQGVAVVDDARVTARAPARDLALGWADTLATTDGIDLHDGGVLGELLEHLHTAGHHSAEIDPVAVIAGAGESLDLAPERSTLRTVVRPSSAGGRDDAREYLTDLRDASGVVSSSTAWHAGTLVRDATIRTEALRRGLGGSHGG